MEDNYSTRTTIETKLSDCFVSSRYISSIQKYRTIVYIPNERPMDIKIIWQKYTEDYQEMIDNHHEAVKEYGC